MLFRSVGLFVFVVSLSLYVIVHVMFGCVVAHVLLLLLFLFSCMCTVFVDHFIVRVRRILFTCMLLFLLCCVVCRACLYYLYVLVCVVSSIMFYGLFIICHVMWLLFMW